MSSEFDIAAGARQAWVDFRSRLADRIAEIGDDDIITLSIESGLDDDDLIGAVPYVQLLGWGEDMVRAEVVSNEYLDERFELSTIDEERLVDIGWLEPTYVEGDEPDHGSTNFHLDAEGREADRLAVMAVRALREVFGCLHPAFLETRGLGEDAAEAIAELPGASYRASAEPVATYPASPEELQRLVDQALAAVFDEPVQHDDDGDIPVVCGQSVIFVRVSRGRPAVDLYCQLVHGVQDLERAAQEVGILNGSHPSVRFLLRDDMVLATYRIYAWPFAPAQLRMVLAELSDEIDGLARDLATRVGGYRFAEVPDEVEVYPLTGLLELLHDGPARPGQVAALFDNDRLELIAQIVRLRTGRDSPGEHDLELVLGQLRAALRFVADKDSLQRRPRSVPARPDRSRQLTLLPESEDTLDDGQWVGGLEESS